MSSDNPYAAPEANFSTVREFSRDEDLASRGTRLAAAIIDAFIGFAYLVPLVYLFGLSNAFELGQTPSFEKTAGLTVGGFLCFLAIHGYFLKTSGQTLAKKLLGIRIATLDGDLPEFGGLILRRYLVVSAITFIPMVGRFFPLLDVFFIFGEDRRCLHDYFAGTQVLKIGSRRFDAGFRATESSTDWMDKNRKPSTHLDSEL